MKKRQEILALHRAGISYRKIAEQLNVDKGSVNDLVNKVETEREKYFVEHPDVDKSIIIPYEVEEPKYVRKSGLRPRKITPDEDEKLKGFLADNEEEKRTHRSKQLKTVKAMCDDLNAVRDKDNKLGYTTVKDRVRQLKAESAKPKEAYIMQEHEPGYEGRFDWCEAGLKIGDDADFMQYQMGVLVSVCSGFVYARVYYKQDTDAFLDMHSKCFEFLGVVYEEMVYDNAKVQVKKIVGMTEKEPTEAMLRVANRVQKIHMRRTSSHGYNKEISLQCVIQLAYVAAEDRYNAVLEMPAGDGFADVAIIPMNCNDPVYPPMIVELKVDGTKNKAMNQIVKRNYVNFLSAYHGDVVLVGISYDKKRKGHLCRIQRVVR